MFLTCPRCVKFAQHPHEQVQIRGDVPVACQPSACLHRMAGKQLPTLQRERVAAQQRTTTSWLGCILSLHLGLPPELPEPGGR